MAAPTAAANGANGFVVATAGTTANMAYQSGNPAAGDLLLEFIRFAGAPGTVTFTGHSVLAGPDTSDASDDTTVIYYRWCDGAEGASDPISWANSIKACAQVYVISGADNPSISLPQVSTVAVGTTAANSANSNSVAPASPPQDTLYCTFAAADGENAFTGAPSGYAQLQTQNTLTAGAAATNCFLGIATKSATASSSDDPGAWTHTAANSGWTAWTVAVRPPQTTPPRNAAVNFQDPGVLMEKRNWLWLPRRPKLWLPSPALHTIS